MGVADHQCGACGKPLLPVNGQWMCCIRTCTEYAKPISPSGTEAQ
jgi:uncharacterized Zn finger protein (UPF0148 family)